MLCETCGKGFLQRTADHKHCSVRCRSAAYRRKIGSNTCCMNNCPARVNFQGGQLCSFHYRLYQEGAVDRARLIRERGTGTFDKKGYIVVTINGERLFEHRILAERALGRPLPKGVQVHHMNEKPWDNYTPFNLVICPDDAYHKLLHRRARALNSISDDID